MRRLACIALSLIPLVAPASGEDGEEAAPPEILIASPFAVLPGQAAAIILRGKGIDSATSFETDPAVAIEIVTKEKKGPPDQTDAAEAGESRAEIVLSIPRDARHGSAMNLTVTGAPGRSQPVEILILDPAQTIREDSTADGFANAQPIAPGQSVVGRLSNRSDVDTFRLELADLAPVTIELSAARQGSLADGTLAIHDRDGHRLAWSDDTPDTGRDPTLTFTPPSPGIYLVVLTDANARGSDESHPYVLRTRRDA